MKTVLIRGRLGNKQAIDNKFTLCGEYSPQIDVILINSLLRFPQIRDFSARMQHGGVVPSTECVANLW